MTRHGRWFLGESDAERGQGVPDAANFAPSLRMAPFRAHAFGVKLEDILCSKRAGFPARSFFAFSTHSPRVATPNVDQPTDKHPGSKTGDGVESPGEGA